MRRYGKSGIQNSFWKEARHAENDSNGIRSARLYATRYRSLELFPRPPHPDPSMRQESNNSPGSRLGDKQSSCARVQ